MHETLLAAARTAGAEVARGARVRNVEPGETPAVTFERDGKEERVTARLVAGCDGRNSSVRRWAGFVAEKDADRCQISGLLIEDVAAPEDTLTVAFDTAAGTGTILFPQGGGRARTYYAQRVAGGRRFSGDGDVTDYLAAFASKLPNGAAVMKEARASGPLATFNGADDFVPHPYKDGVALVGDAASSSDPTWGQGLSLTVRDARTLRDELLKNDDWDAAGQAYAEEHDRYYGHIRACEDIFTMIFYEGGPDADARRARAIPLIAQDQTRVPDTMQSGPDAAPITAGVRSRFLGEE
jgi:2-polyprenyl-6-methoxyphenol hydroxylase-like FAD-dependent oxidoreductase